MLCWMGAAVPLSFLLLFQVIFLCYALTSTFLPLDHFCCTVDWVWIHKTLYIILWKILTWQTFELCSWLLLFCKHFIRIKCHTTDGDIGNGYLIWVKSPYSPPYSFGLINAHRVFPQCTQGSSRPSVLPILLCPPIYAPLANSNSLRHFHRQLLLIFSLVKTDTRKSQ